MMKIVAYIIKIISFNIVIFLILCLFFELLLRILLPNYALYKRTYPGQYQKQYIPRHNLQKDRDLGWVSAGSIIYGSDNISYEINKQGFRDDNDFDAKTINYSKTRIMVLGDSFVFGVDVKKNSNIPSFLQVKLGSEYQVFNLGIPGWGIDQMYLAYKKYVPIIKPQMVILFFIDSDISRVFEAFRAEEMMSKPSFDIADGKLELRRERTPNILEGLFQNSYLLNELYERGYRKYYSKKITRLIFLQLVADTQRNNERLMVIRLPCLHEIRPRNIYYIFKKHFYNFSNLFRKNNLSYFELYNEMIKLPEKEHEKLYNLGDPHLSGYGCEFTADFMIKYFRKLGWISNR
jgi:hypothetical protein